MTVFEHVEKFIEKFNFKKDFNSMERVDFAINTLIAEEMHELEIAFQNSDAEETIDALGDLAWLCIKLMYQLDVDPHKVFDEIGRANITKVRGIKKGRENSGGYDVMKPLEWEAPSHKDNHGRLDEIFETTSTS